MSDPRQDWGGAKWAAGAARQRAEAAWSGWRARQRPGLGAQIASVLILALLIGLALLVIIPAVALGLAAIVVYIGVSAARRGWRALTGRTPRSERDPRRNVRVIVRRNG